MLAWLAALAWLVGRYRPFRADVQGESMAPTLVPGDWVIALRGLPIAHGDLVVAEQPGRPGFEVVKRVSGAPGEAGLGADQWFVTGDNPARSTDSRTFGPLPRSAIRGRVVLVYWPPRRWRVVRRARA